MGSVMCIRDRPSPFDITKAIGVSSKKLIIKKKVNLNKFIFIKL